MVAILTIAAMIRGTGSNRIHNPSDCLAPLSVQVVPRGVNSWDRRFDACGKSWRTSRARRPRGVPEHLAPLIPRTVGLPYGPYGFALLQSEAPTCPLNLLLAHTWDLATAPMFQVWAGKQPQGD